MGYESGFSHEKVWGIGYGRGMGYGTHLLANGIGGTKNLWGIGNYGLGEVWVSRLYNKYKQLVVVDRQFPAHLLSHYERPLDSLDFLPWRNCLVLWTTE